MSTHLAKKSQVATTDLILSMILVLLFIGLMIAAFMWTSKKNSTQYIYGSLVFDNIEGSSGSDFMNDYKIMPSRLDTFNALVYDDMRQKILNNTDFIPEIDDVCVFTKDDTTITYQTGVDASVCNTAKPCDDYTLKYIFAKPVEYYQKMQNLLVVVCIK